MLKVNKQEIDISYELERKINWVCKFSNTTPVIKNYGQYSKKEVC